MAGVNKEKHQLNALTEGLISSLEGSGVGGRTPINKEKTTWSEGDNRTMTTGAVVNYENHFVKFLGMPI